MRRLVATSMLFVGLLMIPQSALGFLGPEEDIAMEASRTPDYELMEKAELAENSGDVRLAVIFYGVLSQRKSSPYERRASARFEWLKARTEGNAVPLSAFLKVRNNRNATRDDLVAFWKEAEKFPTGLVKRDAAAFVGEALLNRMKDPAAALPVFEAWAREPNIDRSELELAISGAALAKGKLGDYSGATALLREHKLTMRPEWRFLRVQSFRQIAHPIALASVALFAVLALATLAMGFRQAKWREVIGPKPWLTAAYVIVFPCVLAVKFSPAIKHTYVDLAIGLALTIGLAIVASVGARSVNPKLRGALAASAFLCCFAVGLMVAEESEMLEGFMLWYGV